MVAKLGIVLATYNEAETLPPLIEMLEGLSVPLEIHIFVVDDSSPDGTSSVAQRLASRVREYIPYYQAGQARPGLGPS